MKSFLYLFILTGIIISCSTKENDIPVCEVDNPIEELEWLKEIKNSIDSCLCETSIYQGLYKGQTVFYMVCRPECCDMGDFTLWDCNGNIVKEFRIIDYDPEEDKVENIKTLYTCEK